LGIHAIGKAENNKLEQNGGGFSEHRYYGLSGSFCCLKEEEMFAAPDSRQGLFWVAFVNQVVHQPYKRSQKVPNLSC
jgi:hypothetical protein